MNGITRRQFVKVSSAGVLVTACGSDAEAPKDTFEVGEEAEVAVEVDAAPELPEPETEVAQDTEPDVAPEVDSGPAVPAVIGHFDPGAVPEAPRSAFLFGVQAGDPNGDGAVLWTRFTPGAPAPALAVQVFSDGAILSPGDVYVSQPVVIAAGGFVHVEVAGLAPDTRYRYCFVTAGDAARSPIGRFRTAPTPDTVRVVTFGGTSCVNADYQPYRALNRAAEAGLDFFVLAGDTTYCDGAATLEEYYAKWTRSFDSDGYRALLGNVGTYATWDDHEVDDDWNPELIAPEKLANAQRVYLEHIALRLAPPVDPVDPVDPIANWKIWRSYRWGKTVELFILDCRSERLPSTHATSQAQYLSRAQLDWLERGLRQSPCTFKLIVNTVPITDMPEGYPAEQDRWQRYQPQRDEILSFISGPPLIPGVLWLSGDFHFGAVARVNRPGQRFDDQWEIFMGQGANMTNPAWAPIRDSTSGQFAFVTGTNNYVRFVCDPFATPPRITAEITDGDGTVLHTQVFENPAS